MAVIISLLTDIIRGLKAKLTFLEHQYLVGTLAFLFGFLLIAPFIDVFEASKVAILFWLYTGLASGIIINHHVETHHQ